MALFDFGSIKRSLQSVVGQIRSLRSDIEKRKRTREDVATAPAAKEDIKAAVRAWADAAKLEYQKRLRATLGSLISTPADLEKGNLLGRMTVAGAFHQIGGIEPGPKAVDGLLCTFFGQGLIDGFMKSIDQMDWPREGLPLAERARRLEALDKEIADLTEQLAELTKAASEAGVTLE